MSLLDGEHVRRRRGRNHGLLAAFLTLCIAGQYYGTACLVVDAFGPKASSAWNVAELEMATGQTLRRSIQVVEYRWVLVAFTPLCCYGAYVLARGIAERAGDWSWAFILALWVVLVFSTLYLWKTWQWSGSAVQVYTGPVPM